MSTATLDRHHESLVGAGHSSADCVPFRPIRPARPSGPTFDGRPNYALRRVVAGLVTVVVLLMATVALSSLLASLGGDPAVAAEARPAVAGSSAVPTSHVAVDGDTLWSIADSYRGEVGHARYVEALIRLNGGASIQMGQSVRLP